MRPHRRLLAAGALLTALGLAAATRRAPRTEILWDTWGVPHIYAGNAVDLFYAFAWAQMASHGDLLLRLYGEARGRAAEYWGAQHLDSDHWVRTMGIPARAAEWYRAQRPEFRRYLDACAGGINAYARAHPELLADSLEAVLPIDGTDVLAHVQRVLHFTFIVGPGVVGSAERHLATGSNAWAVAPSRSASGRAMLLANPHLPWSGLFTWFEMQLVAPGVNLYGATLVGLAAPGIGFNDRLGWTHTVNTIDAADLYQLALAPGGYRFDGAVRPFETRIEALKIRAAGGTVREESLTVRHSTHGPVIAERGDKAVALRVAGLDAPHMLEQWWEMGRARNLEQFEQALMRLQLPLFTVMYADRDGRVMHVFGGRVPVRSSGGWDTWAGVVPGDTSATLWTATHPYRDLPRVVDPSSGWLQNANDPPWTTTFPPALDPARFPAYLAPRRMGLRPQRSARMLAEDSSITFEEMIAYKHSTRLELADRLLDDLFAAVEAHGDSLARRAAAVLAAWDREADAESRGAVLFEQWARAAGPRLFAISWRGDQPTATPDGLLDPPAAARALGDAARQVEQRYGALDVPWGDVHRLRLNGRDLPANGGPGSPLGIFRVVDYDEAPDGRLIATGGDSWVAAIEFSNPVRARVLLSSGNATQPHSRHQGDQLELFARKELRPVWRTRADVEAHLEAREVVGR